jgi:hypothetical protein
MLTVISTYVHHVTFLPSPDVSEGCMCACAVWSGLKDCVVVRGCLPSAGGQELKLCFGLRSSKVMFGQSVWLVRVRLPAVGTEYFWFQCSCDRVHFLVVLLFLLNFGVTGLMASMRLVQMGQFDFLFVMTVCVSVQSEGLRSCERLLTAHLRTRNWNTVSDFVFLKLCSDNLRLAGKGKAACGRNGTFLIPVQLRPCSFLLL